MIMAREPHFTPTLSASERRRGSPILRAPTFQCVSSHLVVAEVAGGGVVAAEAAAIEGDGLEQGEDLAADGKAEILRRALGDARPKRYRLLRRADVELNVDQRTAVGRDLDDARGED